MIVDATVLLYAEDASSPHHASPLSPAEAWSRITAWLAAPSAWIPLPTERHAEVLGRLVATHQLRGTAVPDAHLAALAVEHGVGVCSADTDFARFPEVTWHNPLV